VELLVILPPRMVDAFHHPEQLLAYVRGRTQGDEQAVHYKMLLGRAAPKCQSGDLEFAPRKGIWKADWHHASEKEFFRDG
jgi:hypothetical protein